jgi:hypothetical protein
MDFLRAGPDISRSLIVILKFNNVAQPNARLEVFLRVFVVRAAKPIPPGHKDTKKRQDRNRVLAQKHYVQVHHVGAGGARENQVIQPFEEMIRVVILERLGEKMGSELQRARQR